jgi:histidinol-phosphate phosphatase family protein
VRADLSSAHRAWFDEGAPRGAPALFIDRDGTLIEERHYLSDPAKVVLIPGAAETLRRFRDAGHALVLITNQSGIGSGRFGWEAFEAVASRLHELLAAEGLALDAELVCGHSADATCGWRKPQPGMILAAAEELATDLTHSTLVGDKCADIEAGAFAGVARTAHVLSGHGVAERARVEAAGFGPRLQLIDSIADLRP